jgi:hypothetical protein
VGGNFKCEFYTFIRPNRKIQLYRRYGRNRTRDPAIPVPGSNQLNYRVQFSSSSCTFMHQCKVYEEKHLICS